ncbi:MAG TPA: TIGR02453 family protein [Candidatus Solibacter sp.]|jgi:uncharacterized protein (TIGR02453 family)|nr:TIGR02453 family protein [Candidatus Solibacter sp.]
MATREVYFTPALFDFLRQLKKHNDRKWFQENKARYEADVRDPALRFIEAIGPGLRKISPHIVADPKPVGGSLFRINRDIRFSKDKSPYKTAVGISFHHDRGRSAAAPGMYVQLGPGASWSGGGVHMPGGRSLTQIRDAIVAKPSQWTKIVSDPSFSTAVANQGETLKRAPQGYDADHPLVEDLKRKSFVWHADFTESEVCSPEFLDSYLAACRLANPFNAFLASALGVDW